MIAAIGWFFSFVEESVSRLSLPYSVIGVIFTVFLGLDGLFQPAVLNVKSDKPVAERIEGIVPEGKIYSYRTNIAPATECILLRLISI